MGEVPELLEPFANGVLDEVELEASPMKILLTEIRKLEKTGMWIEVAISTVLWKRLLQK